jgi:hypothetical protein
MVPLTPHPSLPSMGSGVFCSRACQAIAGCRELRFGKETSALKGDFILHIRLFRGSREANDNEFYVGLPRDFEGDVSLYQA